MRIIRYTEDHRQQWEEFVSKSKNGTFHLSRNFIDYHGSKFNDHSLLAFNDEELVGVLPMNEVGKNVYSHQGLTYGGWNLSSEIRLHEFHELFKSFLNYLSDQGFEALHYKTIPYMYHQLPSQEDIHMMHLAGAICSGQHVNPVIMPSNFPAFQERRIRGIKKALKEGIRIEVSESIDAYYTIVEDLLKAYDSKPAHSREELIDLKKRFPNEIILHAAFVGNEMCAGILCFETPNCVRFQYIASTLEGKDKGALDLLFATLIQETYSKKNFIDFGTSTNNQGASLALGISQQKEGFGARTSVQPIYTLALNSVNWDALNAFVS
ncbi:MAG: hypothetical protein RLZZ155_940 [Bacteroidota bacterium]|jgi:hypothetical protein